MVNFNRHSQEPTSYATQLAANVKLAMRVGGPADGDGKAAPLRSAALQRTTGIARSTLRALTNANPNPDLQTLSRLAGALGIPLGFLLMRPEDWCMLSQALNDMPALVTATENLIGRKPLAVPIDAPERVLRECRLQPEDVPYGLGANTTEIGRVARRNELRRRSSNVLGNLLLHRAAEPDAKVFLTALAASIAHQLSFFDESPAKHHPLYESHS